MNSIKKFFTQKIEYSKTEKQEAVVSMILILFTSLIFIKDIREERIRTENIDWDYTMTESERAQSEIEDNRSLFKNIICSTYEAVKKVIVFVMKATVIVLFILFAAPIAVGFVLAGIIIQKL